MQRLIRTIIDFFYRPFARFIPAELFRYAACGGGNVVLDWVLYFLTFHALLLLPDIPVRPHTLAFFIVFPITLYTGFWLNRHITFTSSTLRGRTQLIRYSMIVALNLAVNYAGLRLLVEGFGWYPTPSKVTITIITVCISFFGQKYFSFRQ